MTRQEKDDSSFYDEADKSETINRRAVLRFGEEFPPKPLRLEATSLKPVGSVPIYGPVCRSRYEGRWMQLCRTLLAVSLRVVR